MSENILNNLAEIKKLDSQNMLGSLESLGYQVEEIQGNAQKLKLPAAYKNVKNIVVLGMGGSTLGAHVIKSLFWGELKVPLEIINGYHIPRFVDAKTLVIASSYSGTTEEPIAALKEAEKCKAKLMIITSGGTLAELAKRKKIPALVFTTKNNPCGSPRMGLGYSIIGQMILFSKAGLLPVSAADLDAFQRTLGKYQQQFGVRAPADKNLAKQIALQTRGKSVWYAGAEHLSGNAHIAANQMNENAKRFAGFFLIPELNHHLMEGMLQPKSNKDALLFVLIESGLYDKRVQKRFEITKNILGKNGIPHMSYVCQEKTKLGQMGELLLLSSYTSYYSALLEGIDPTAIPFVDFFKEQLDK